MTNPMTCQIEDCGRPMAYSSRGWCKTHYSRFKKHGTTDPNPRCMFEGTWEDRFWAKVDRSDADGCWEWTAHRSPKGYGAFTITGQTPTRAHRYAYTITYGPIPDGLMVLHACDNPPCVRPDHLWLGTASDNMRDAYTKGRKSNMPATLAAQAKARARRESAA